MPTRRQDRVDRRYSIIHPCRHRYGLDLDMADRALVVAVDTTPEDRIVDHGDDDQACCQTSDTFAGARIRSMNPVPA